MHTVHTHSLTRSYLPTQGNWYLQRGDATRARYHFERGLTLGDNDAVMNLGIVSEITGQTLDAEAYFNQSLALLRKKGQGNGGRDGDDDEKDVFVSVDADQFSTDHSEFPSILSLLIKRGTLLPRILPRTEAEIYHWRRKMTQRLENILEITTETEAVGQGKEKMQVKGGKNRKRMRKQRQFGTDVLNRGFTMGFYLAYHGVEGNAVHDSNKQMKELLADVYRNAFSKELLYEYVPHHMSSHSPSHSPSHKGGVVTVGFLSRFWESHTVGKLMRGVMARLNRNRFRVVVFHMMPKQGAGNALARQVKQDFFDI